MVSDTCNTHLIARLLSRPADSNGRFGTFSDIATDAEANEGAAQFIRNKIAKIVKDPEKARKLTPYDVYARRPLCDGNAENEQKYFEQFNRPNVDIVNLTENPITQIEPDGVRTQDGQLHEIEVLILATGFDAVEGNYNRMNIQGRNGLSLKEAWQDGPTSAFGMHVPEFPNLFMITGPKGPFTNIIPAVEVQVEWVADLIQRAEKAGTHVIEVTPEAEAQWTTRCDQLASASLFWKATDNWIFGEWFRAFVEVLLLIVDRGKYCGQAQDSAILFWRYGNVSERAGE